jgi:hypothetical protein
MSAAVLPRSSLRSELGTLLDGRLDRAVDVVIERVGVGARLHELSDAFRRTIEGCGGERAHTFPPGKVGAAPRSSSSAITAPRSCSAP